MTVLEQMAESIAAKGSGQLPPSVRQRLKNHLLDAVGAWIAGRATEEGKKLSGLKLKRNRSLSIFNRQPLDRIALGVAITRLTEFDDVHMPSCTTPSSVVVPTALAVAGQLPKQDSQDFAHALIAGYEVMTRFGVAVAGHEISSQGIWPTYLGAPICAAAVTARLLGLTSIETANALAIALSMTSGAPGKPAGESPRWLLLGMAARAGCAAALAAAEGYAGDRTLLDSDWMVRAHGILCDPAALVSAPSGDGAVGALSLKPYCAAKQTIAAIDAFRNLLGQGVLLHDIVSLRVVVPGAYADMIGHRNAANGRIARITSAAYHIALAAYHPDELENVARPNLAGEPEIAAFMARIEIIPEKGLDQIYPRRWPAAVEAVLKDGRMKMDLVLDATGDPLRNSEVDVRAKFHRLADSAIGKPAAKKLADACLNATDRNAALTTICAKFNS